MHCTLYHRSGSLDQFSLFQYDRCHVFCTVIVCTTDITRYFFRRDSFLDPADIILL